MRDNFQTNPPPHLRLAIGMSKQQILGILSRLHRKPSLLVSYVYLKQFLPILKRRDLYTEWVLDSGAFSAYNSGVELKLQDYIDTIKSLADHGIQPCEIFGLDVIGDWKAGIRNVELMWKAGIQAIPCYHAGEPEEVLTGIAKDYPKIALGGSAMRMKGHLRFQFLEQSFNRVYPKKIHGFGVGQKEYVLGLPFHTTDCTSWLQGPSRFGNWLPYGRKVKIRLLGDMTNMIALNADYLLRIENQARSKWRKEMERLNEPQTYQKELAHRDSQS